MRAEGYRWSSARAHVLGLDDPMVERGNELAKSIADWRAYLKEGEPPGWREALQHATQTGRPLGSEGFIARMGAWLGRTLEVRPRGRPAKGRMGREINSVCH